MSLKYAILGLLKEKPMHGYELRQRFRQMLGYFWRMSHGSLYPILKKLEREGLVTSEKLPQEGKPDAKVYSLTEQGEEAFLEWLRQPVEEVVPSHDSLVLKLAFFEHLTKEEALGQLHRIRGFYAQTVQGLKQAHQAAEERSPYQALIVEGGIAHFEAALAWVDKMIARLEV